MMWAKDMGVREMVLEHVMFKIILLHIQGLHCKEGIFDLEDHVGQEALSFQLVAKDWVCKKIPFTSFPNHLLKFFWVKSTFPYV